MEIQQWREFLIPYEQAVQELVIKFQNIIREYTSLGQYSPIEQVNGRVKKISSILEKVDKLTLEKQRKGTGKIAFIGGKRISLVVKWI